MNGLLTLVSGILGAAATMAGAGVVHYDVKPDNFLAALEGLPGEWTREDVRNLPKRALLQHLSVWLGDNDDSELPGVRRPSWECFTKYKCSPDYATVAKIYGHDLHETPAQVGAGASSGVCHRYAQLSCSIPVLQRPPYRGKKECSDLSASCLPRHPAYPCPFTLPSLQCGNHGQRAWAVRVDTLPTASMSAQLPFRPSSCSLATSSHLPQTMAYQAAFCAARVLADGQQWLTLVEGQTCIRLPMLLVHTRADVMILAAGLGAMEAGARTDLVQAAAECEAVLGRVQEAEMWIDDGEVGWDLGP